MAKSLKKASAKKKTAKKKTAVKKTGNKTAAKKKPATRNAAKALAPKRGSESASKLSVGESAPQFQCVADSGAMISLRSLLGNPVVLYFYPKDSTPGCTIEACDFRDSMNRAAAVGAVVLGVSRDSVASHVKFKEKYGLNFPLLADTDGKLCEAYGVWQEKVLYGRKSMGIVRSTFLIDAKGKIAAIWPKVRVEGHVAEVLEALARL
jgi:peroxiredoxin Q/BCP